MMDWKKDLEIKAKELNLEGGESNVQSGSSSRNSNRNNNRRSSDVHISKVEWKGITNVKGKEEADMITREAALDDLEKLEKEATTEDGRLLVKVAKVIVKILATVRSNQLLTDEDKKKIKEARANRQPEKKE